MTIKKIVDGFTANWPVKVLSVAVAIVLFMFHRMSALEERFFSVPLRVRTENALVPASSYPRMVRITLRGEANSVFPILEEDIEAYIDLTKYKGEGVYKAPVLITKKGTAAGVDPLEVHVDPLEVAIAVEFQLTKTVPITPSFRGYLETGFELSSYSLTPSEVEVSGPSTSIMRIEDVTTDFVELSGKKENFTETVKVINRDPLIAVRGDSQIRFTGIIQQTIMIRTLEHLPIILSGLSPAFLARPQVNFGSVKLEGSQNDLEAYIPDASLLSLDCSNIDGEGLYMLPLIVSAPPNFSVVRFDPMEVAVEIAQKKDDGR
ncbi:MAG: hypothetical protein A2Z99_01920 [Treponema sp. GWB1_62_6]|nr:MAG: hypothetical protein A2Y36_08395 [Treponema sp. GWA1_62_8]OHE66696.1 MAG: hypothetical protein A2Z99_01920 [Treponema sp. GWB1_62_6]OHE67874.1 MAG: hypothetical protein A2001_20565 [Treponema sp. GWC1_61_84]HCM27273.1 hypothetical protein [Treponema sp.]